MTQAVNVQAIDHDERNLVRVPGYSHLIKVFESPRTRVFKALRESDHKRVVLKILQEDFLERHEIARYKNQFRILSEAQLQCAPVVLAYEKHQNAPMIVFEDSGGSALQDVLSQARPSVMEGLDIASKLAKVMVEVHSKHIIHKDINPSNVLYNRETGDVKVIDFGISTRLMREQAELSSNGVTEGSLPYMSPEQTGRMNRFVDYRTDFYSLGVTFYQLFSGRLPFESDDPLRLIHHHIAKKPISPRHFNQLIPEVLAELILKLLSKNAEDRYQSAWGIMVDLQRIFKDMKEHASVEKFPLALQDVPDRFHIPEVLYGRQKELDLLVQAFERVCDGRKELCLVSGYSGVGKTSLIRELQRPVSRHNGHYISGKFDPFRRSTPYAAIVDGFRDLVRQLLGESEQALIEWRNKLLQALGPNGQIVVEVIPEIELIIGPQPRYQNLGPTEADNRFKLVFRNFVKVFCEAEHPLVLHLDDLQWIDSASLRLIQMLMLDHRLKHFYLIGSYRNNEVGSHHPLMLLREELEQADVHAQSIHLQPLGAGEVCQLIADALYSTVERVAPLAALVIEKTGGNPFFTDEFLRMLYTDRQLYFNPDKGIWEWNLERIRSANMTDNVVELMSSRIQKLSESSRNLLQLASCIGLIFDLRTLAEVAGFALGDTASRLREAMSQGLIVPIGDGYRLVELEIPIQSQEVRIEYKFTHDRIQQAAYDLIEKSTRKQVRHKVGRSLLEMHRGARRDDFIFAIVNHLNSSTDFIEQESERQELMQLNLTAARRAKVSAAYHTALDYLHAGIALHKESDWVAIYDLMLDLHREAAEVAFLSKSYERMDDHIETVVHRARTLIEKIPAYETRVHAAVARNDMQEAIVLGRDILHRLGVHLPDNPGWLRIGASLLWTHLQLRRRSTEGLLNLPESRDPLHLARMHFLYAMAQALFYFFPRQVPLITCQLLRQTMRHGNTSTSALSYTTYGMLMAAMLGEVKTGYRFGELGIRLYEKLNAKDIEAATLVCFNMFIRPWKDHVRMTLKPLLYAHQAGLDAGDFEFAAHAAAGYCNRGFFVGNELRPLIEEMTKFVVIVEQLGHRGDLEQLKLFQQAASNFCDPHGQPYILKGVSFNEELMLPVYERNEDGSALFNTYFFKSMLAFTFDCFEEAVRFAQTAEPYFKLVMGTLSGAVFYYYALALLRRWKQVDKTTRKAYGRTIQKILRKYKKWAKLAPVNFRHKYLLIRAEWLAIHGKAYAAQLAYDEAIHLSKSHQYLQDEALSNELAAKFHLLHGRQTAAYAYMKRARYNYERWGAVAKARLLEERYPQMLSGPTGERSYTGSLATMSSSTIDITTLKRALLAIAEENVHSRMLEKIISSAIEFAGAQKGVMLLRKEGEFFVEAESSVDQDQPKILQSIAVEHSHNLSRMVINYVRRAKKGLVIDNASVPQDVLPGLHREPYIQKNKIRSILCIPITVGIGEEAEIVGLLYLENNRANATFTAERIETLEIICLAAAGRLELSVKAATDGLTGLYNHDYFQSMLEQETLQSQRQLRNLSLIMIDIDHFKGFNDQWGHQVGDLVLKRVAQAIRETCRKSDIVARYGGEEMAVILPETSPDMASLVAERIRKAIELMSIAHGDVDLKVTISLGVSYLAEDVKNKDALVEKADEALYQSKRSGRNRVTVS
jgi:histidine kinase